MEYDKCIVLFSIFRMGKDYYNILGVERGSTEDDIKKFTFPLKEENETSTTTVVKLSKVEILTITLKAMLANLNGLKTSLTAISTAIKSTSSSGKYLGHINTLKLSKHSMHK